MQTVPLHRSLLPLTPSAPFYMYPMSHSNTLFSNHGDDEDGEGDDVDCHGNTGGWLGRCGTKEMEMNRG